MTGHRDCGCTTRLWESQTQPAARAASLSPGFRFTPDTRGRAQAVAREVTLEGPGDGRAGREPEPAVAVSSVPYRDSGRGLSQVH